MRRDKFLYRGTLVASTILFILIFNWTYSAVIAPVYDSWGLSKNSTPWPYLFVSWVVCIVPSLWMPVRIERPSQLFFLIQYYVIFIPACFILYNVSKPVITEDSALMLIILMFLGLSVLQSVYYVPLIRIKYLRIHTRWFWFSFIVLLFSLVTYLIAAFGSDFYLANLEDIYTVRSALAGAISQRGNCFGFYAQMWLAGFFFPLCFAVGARAKRWWLIAVAMAGYLLLYGLGGSKTTLFSFIYFPAIILWLIYIKKNTIPVFMLGLCFLLVLGICLRMIGLEHVAYWYTAVVNFRTFSIPAQMIAQHYEFFNHNALTYMSHVNILKSFIPFPYDMDIPRTIGMYFYNAPVGANAGFWASDGIAGFGPIGIILMSFVCAFIFWVFDSMAKRYDPRFVIISATFIATTFANTPLPTTLVSGGLGFLFVALWLLPKKSLVRDGYRSPYGPAQG